MSTTNFKLYQTIRVLNLFLVIQILYQYLFLFCSILTQHTKFAHHDKYFSLIMYLRLVEDRRKLEKWDEPVLCHEHHCWWSWRNEQPSLDRKPDQTS